MNLKGRIPPKHVNPQKLLFLLCVFSLTPFILFAQTKKITGTVKDSLGNLLPGISVAVKDKPATGVTNTKGVFSITVPVGAVLTFSSTSYLPYEIQTGEKNVLSVVLKAKVGTLEDVLVVGYGNAKRGDVTSAIVKAPVAEMLLAPVKSIDEALQGRVAGVVVSSNDGQPGSSPNITIRGNNSISQSNAPLYVVDGFPLEGNSFNDIQPGDIESIELLKDASATAIYGARGANGVIMVTTKKGKSGPAVISLDIYAGSQKILKKMELMTPYQFVQYQRERDSLSNNYYVPGGGYFADSTYLRFQSLDFYKSVKGTDFQSQLFTTAPLKNFDLSIRGGNQQTRYSISGNVYDQDGIMINSGFRRYQGRINLDQTVNEQLKLGINLNYSNNVLKGQTPTYINTGFPVSTLNVMNAVWSYRPVTPIGSNGKQAGDLEDLLFDPSVTVPGTSDYRINPVINQQHIVNNNISNNLIANAYLEYKILPSLTLRITGGITANVTRNEQFYDSSTIKGSIQTGIGASSGVNGSVLYAHNNIWLNENILTYNKIFARKHSVTVTGVVSEQGAKTFSNGAAAIFLPDQQLGLSGLDQGTPKQVNAASSNWNLASFTGRMSYDFVKRYYVTFTYRADGSSKFSPKNKWGYFPSGSVKWKFAEEPFLKGNRIMSEGSIRGSYGLTGNNRVDDFSYLSGLNISSINQNAYIFNNVLQPSALPLGLANADLKWETTSQANIGLDLGFFKDRIKLTLDVYRKKTYDLLLNAAIPTSLGYSNAFKNIGSIQNQGLEIALNTINVATKDFRWTSAFNISWNTSKLLELTQNQESITTSIPFDQNYRSLPAYISKIGHPLGEMYGLVWDGVYQYADFDYNTVLNTSAVNAGKGSHLMLKDNITTNGAARASIQPGDIKYKDLNGDGTINSSDYTVIGRGMPVHTGGLSNSFTYKGFDLNIFFQWSYGNDIQNANEIFLNGNANNQSYFNQFEKYTNRWTATNQSGNLFRTGGYGTSNYSSRTIEDGSYIRLKTLAFGYSLSPSLLKKWHVKALRLYASAQNVITWTNYSGMDPEISTFNSALTPGFDFSGYPRNRTVIIGANVTF